MLQRVEPKPTGTPLTVEAMVEALRNLSSDVNRGARGVETTTFGCLRAAEVGRAQKGGGS